MNEANRNAVSKSTFGSAIAKARKEKGLSLKEVAQMIEREDGGAISPQYLNDIEHDRRSPTSDRMVKQIAAALGLDLDWLYWRAGQFPEDVRKANYTPQEINRLMTAFRANPKK